MTASTTTHSPSSRDVFIEVAKASALTSAVIGTVAVGLNNLANFVNLGGLSDASNYKVAISSAILGTAGTLGFVGSVPLEEDMGRVPITTAIGTGLAGATGFAIGNMFTGGWFEKGSLGMAAGGAGVAGAYSIYNRVKNGASSAKTKGKSGRVSRMLNSAKDKLPSLSPRNQKIAKGLGAGAATLAVTEASNVFNWPFGGFNNVGAFLSAGAVSAGVVYGGKVKEKIAKLNENHPVATKIGGAAVGLLTVGAGLYAWNKGWISGNGSGKSGDHSDKVPTTSGNGSTSTSQATSTTLAPTTSGNTSTTALNTTSTSVSSSSSTSIAPPALLIPRGNGGQLTLEAFRAGNKAKVMEQINGLGITGSKADRIFDTVTAEQFNNVTEHGDKFAKFIETTTQGEADSMFANRISELAAA